MDILRQLFRMDEIEKLTKENSWLKNISKEHIKKILKVLSDQKCNNKELRNIILTNPDVLQKDPDELEELIYKIKEYNVIHLNKTMNNYPYILNKKAYEIDTFIFLKQKDGLTEEEMIRLLENEPYKIDMTIV